MNEDEKRLVADLRAMGIKWNSVPGDRFIDPQTDQQFDYRTPTDFTRPKDEYIPIFSDKDCEMYMYTVGFRDITFKDNIVTAIFTYTGESFMFAGKTVLEAWLNAMKSAHQKYIEYVRIQTGNNGRI